MDRKFFFFRREPESETSASFSDTGVGLSTIAIPSENLTFITAGKKKVVFTFKDCNGFDESVLQEGESIPKANITVACKEGDEAGLIEDVINFMSRDTAKNIMKFDVVEGKSTFDKAVVDTVDDVRSIIPASPIKTTTKELAVGDEAKKFQGTIGEIFFGENLPELDYNHTSMAGLAHNAAFDPFPNSGTAGSAHNLTQDLGSTRINDPSNASGESTMAKKGVAIGSINSYNLANDFTISNDYTIYAVFNTNGIATDSDYGIGALYGDAAGEAFGFGARPSSSGRVTSTNKDFHLSRNVFCVRHSGLNGYPAFVDTTSTADGTKSFEIPDPDPTSPLYQPNNVFIIRRDKDFNMYLHNRDGDIVARIPAVNPSGDPVLGGSVTDSGIPGRTDGDLVLNAIGETGGESVSGKVLLNRFGVINRDIGANEAANLANQLFALYRGK